MAGGINVGRWLRKVTGKPITVGSTADIIASIRSNVQARETLEAQMKRELLESLELDRWERALMASAPMSAQTIAEAFASIRAAVTDWQL